MGTNKKMFSDKNCNCKAYNKKAHTNNHRRILHGGFSVWNYFGGYRV